MAIYPASEDLSQRQDRCRSVDGDVASTAEYGDSLISNFQISKVSRYSKHEHQERIRFELIRARWCRGHWL